MLAGETCAVGNHAGDVVGVHDHFTGFQPSGADVLAVLNGDKGAEVEAVEALWVGDGPLWCLVLLVLQLVFYVVEGVDVGFFDLGCLFACESHNKEDQAITSELVFGLFLAFGIGVFNGRKIASVKFLAAFDGFHLAQHFGVTLVERGGDGAGGGDQFASVVADGVAGQDGLPSGGCHGVGLLMIQVDRFPLSIGRRNRAG